MVIDHNIAGRLPEDSHDRPLWLSMKLKQLKKQDSQIDHQSFTKPQRFFVLDSDCHFYDTRVYIFELSSNVRRNV